MKKTNNYRVLAQKWFDKAENDFRYAEVGLRESYVFPQVAFLAQQVAEKYLKGFLVLNGKEPPRTHILPSLLKQCIVFAPELADCTETCGFLTHFYTETRYPGDDIPDPNREEIQKAFDAAQEVKERIEKLTNLTRT